MFLTIQTFFLKSQQSYSIQDEGSYQKGKGQVEPKELEVVNEAHLVKIYKPPPTFDSTGSTTATSEPGATANNTNHVVGNGVGPPKSPRHVNGGTPGTKLPNGKAWAPEEVLTTAL